MGTGFFIALVLTDHYDSLNNLCACIFENMMHVNSYIMNRVFNDILYCEKCLNALLHEDLQTSH